MNNRMVLRLMIKAKYALALVALKVLVKKRLKILVQKEINMALINPFLIW